jgi:hypothetical protein
MRVEVSEGSAPLARFVRLHDFFGDLGHAHDGMCVGCDGLHGEEDHWTLSGIEGESLGIGIDATGMAEGASLRADLLGSDGESVDSAYRIGGDPPESWKLTRCPPRTATT